MAFGACLIGVAIDYSIHVLDHHTLDPGAEIRALVRRLRASVLVGGLTTMASFVGLALTSFPGFREIGFFSTVGIGASLFVTLFVLPAFLSGERRAGPRRRSPRASRARSATRCAGSRCARASSRSRRSRAWRSSRCSRRGCASTTISPT